MNKSQRPYKLLIKPSKTAVKRLVQKLNDVVHQHQGTSQERLIKALNPIVVGWANYHRPNVASRTFAYLDSVLYWQLRRWARRRHPNQGQQWVRHRYWHSIGRRNWVFGVTQSDKMTVRLARFSDVSIRRHIKVRGNKSWYDNDWTYWATRRGHHPTTSVREAALLKQQRGRCPICRSVFDVHDAIDQDHIWPTAKGGRDGYQNLQLVHRSCHHRKTRWDNQGWCPVRPWGWGKGRRGAV